MTLSESENHQQPVFRTESITDEDDDWESHMTREVNDIQHLVGTLRHIYQPTEHRPPRRRKQSIAACGHWRRQYTEIVVPELKIELNKRTIWKENVSFVWRKAEKRSRSTCFEIWNLVTTLNRPVWERKVGRANEMRWAYWKRWLGVIWDRWSKTAMGPSSRKIVAEQYRRRMEEARLALYKERNPGNPVGLLTNDVVAREMHKRFIRNSDEERRRRAIVTCFDILKRLGKEGAFKKKTAAHHYRFRTLSNILRKWAEWTHLRDVGLDWARWRHDPRRTLVTYNPHAVEFFARTRLLKIAFQPWKSFAAKHAGARKLGKRMLSDFVLRHLRSWRNVTIRHRTLLSRAITSWKEHTHSATKRSFRLWKQWATRKINRRNDQRRLLTVYHRSKYRKRMWDVFRAWRHQTVYGRITGLYSRTELMKSLVEQKHHCRQMQEQMELYVESVANMARDARKNEQLIRMLKDKLLERDETMVESKMALHNAEQEIVRMQCIVNCVERLHPEVTKHLLNIQPDLNFKQRGLEPFIELRTNNTGEREISNRMTRKLSCSVSDERSSFMKRNDWVMQRTSLRNIAASIMMSSSTTNDDTTYEDVTTATSSDENSDNDVIEELRRLSALFEFLRTGDTSILPPGEASKWTKWSSIRHPNDDFTSDPSTRFRKEDNVTGWQNIVNTEDSMSWDDFNLILNRKMPKKRTFVLVEERILKRVQQRREESEENEHDAEERRPTMNIYNLYRGFAEDCHLNDSPREWDVTDDNV